MSKVGDGERRIEDQLPIGYRQAVVSAIALFLSLSIAFLRFYGFEAPGSWTLASTGSAMLTAVGIVLLLIACSGRSTFATMRCLSHYRVTVRILFWGIVVVLVGAPTSWVVLAIERG